MYSLCVHPFSSDNLQGPKKRCKISSKFEFHCEITLTCVSVGRSAKAIVLYYLFLPMNNQHILTKLFAFHLPYIDDNGREYLDWEKRSGNSQGFAHMLVGLLFLFCTQVIPLRHCSVSLRFVKLYCLQCPDCNKESLKPITKLCTFSTNALRSNERTSSELRVRFYVIIRTIILLVDLWSLHSSSPYSKYLTVETEYSPPSA